MLAINRANKKRWLRRFRRRSREAIELGQQADRKIESLLIRRFDRLMFVQRFVFLWILLFVLMYFCLVYQIRALSPYYQSLQPVPGGLYTEGIIGSFTNANPLYASGTADTAVSRLVFSGLFKYDTRNMLIGDLAKDWTLDAAQTRYTVHLKRNITWHDGQPFSADDVLFTYKTIQNVGSQSSLYASWQGINVTKQDNFTVNFDLPNPLSSFPYAMTNGLVPAHLLKDIPVQNLRSAAFNTNPVGSGPFIWKFAEVTGSNSADRQQRLTLAQFSKYWAGRPKLDGFSLITFSNDQRLISAFQKKQINAMGGLESVPEGLSHDKSVEAYTTPLSSAVMAFFNNSRPNLSDVNIRKALVSGVDRLQTLKLSPHPVNLVDSPLLHSQLGYDPTAVELSYNAARANQLLDQAGWPRGQAGQRFKNGQLLSLNLVSQDTQQYTKVSQFLQQQWGQLGIKVNVRYYNGDDLQSAVIANHAYDILLYAISIGVDPDVFAYWDSTQASLNSQGHLNLSEYKSGVADVALEGARTRADPALRLPKYKAFLGTWSQDAPALALYQPDFLYITRGPIFNYARKADNSGVDRFYNVDNWMVRQKRQTLN